MEAGVGCSVYCNWRVLIRRGLKRISLCVYETREAMLDSHDRYAAEAQIKSSPPLFPCKRANSSASYFYHLPSTNDRESLVRGARCGPRGQRSENSCRNLPSICSPVSGSEVMSCDVTAVGPVMVMGRLLIGASVTDGIRHRASAAVTPS